MELFAPESTHPRDGGRRKQAPSLRRGNPQLSTVPPFILYNIAETGEDRGLIPGVHNWDYVLETPTDSSPVVTQTHPLPIFPGEGAKGTTFMQPDLSSKETLKHQQAKPCAVLSLTSRPHNSFMAISHAWGDCPASMAVKA